MHAPRTAIDQIMREFNADTLIGFREAFSAVLQSSLGEQALKAWPVGGVKLSQRLYQNAQAVSATAKTIIEQHLKGLHNAQELRKALYEGYNFQDDPLKIIKPLPKYLQVEFDKFKAAQLKTPALRAAYLEAIRKAEAGAGMDAIEKQLRIAFYERNRYFANRIARTELHRAYTDQQARELMEQDHIQYVQIRLSSKHPKTDICDYHAKVDLYGLGPGVYPKAEAPKPPFHPHCYCLTAPRIDLIHPKPRFNPKAERAFLSSLPAKEAAQVAGSYAKLQQVLKGGTSLETIYNAGKDALYQWRRVGDFGQDAPMNPSARAPWSTDLTDVEIVADTSIVQRHPAYSAAKQGDLNAALQLVSEVIDDEQIRQLIEKYGEANPLLTGVQAIEGASVNVIPQAMVAWLAKRAGFEMENSLVQINRVGHTKSSGWHRLAYQAQFDGDVQPGRAYLLIDDFIGQGGTLANLRALIEKRGGRVIGAMALTGKAYSSKLALTNETLNALRVKYGNLESWWREQFGFGFDALTESEGRYLLRAEDADTIRNRLAEAKQKGGA